MYSKPVANFFSIGCEMTGDTVHFGENAWNEAKDATIMYVYLFLSMAFRELDRFSV